MTLASLTVERCGFAVVQDLGRVGYASIGVSANGAGDQRSARTANTLVGNPDGAPVIEVLASQLDLVTDADLILSVTGAVDAVMVNGHPWSAWEALFIPAGSRIQLPTPRIGQRSYVAVNGVLAADAALGSVAPDLLLGVGRRLSDGDVLSVSTDFTWDHGALLPLCRLGAQRSRLGSPMVLHALPGPDVDRLRLGVEALAGSFEVLPQSDHVGIRLTGGPLELRTHEEILSRGVPIGAVEVPPSGELIILMRGRLATAGYPVVAVLTTPSLDVLAQALPGDHVRVVFTDLATARKELLAQDAAHADLAARVQRAFEARGLDGLLSPQHASIASTVRVAAQ